MAAVPARLRSSGRLGLPEGWDAGLALGLAAVALIDAGVLRLTPELSGRGPVLLALAVAGPLALRWRRRAPIGGAAALAAVVAVQSLTVAPTTTLTQIVSVLVAAFSVGVHAPLRRAVGGILVLVAAIELVSLRSGSSVGQQLSVIPFLAVPCGAGLAVRAARGYAGRLERLTAQLVEERHRSEALAVADERRRIARDLHDVVAHGVGVMAVQAGGARLVLDSDVDRAREALLTIEATGRSALVELERVVGLLRTPGEKLDGAPLPVLRDVAGLLERLRRGGLVVDAEMVADDALVPLPVQTAAYRVIQESLTNALKHAPGAPVHVRLQVVDRTLRVVVRNDRSPRTRYEDGDQPGGHGLLGLRERVTLFGGEVAAGPLDDGGWSVRVCLPLGDRSAS